MKWRFWYLFRSWLKIHSRHFSKKLTKKKKIRRDDKILSYPSFPPCLFCHSDFGWHVTSRDQGLYPRRQGKKRRESLGMRLNLGTILARAKFKPYVVLEIRYFETLATLYLFSSAKWANQNIAMPLRALTPYWLISARAVAPIVLS